MALTVNEHSKTFIGFDSFPEFTADISWNGDTTGTSPTGIECQVFRRDTSAIVMDWTALTSFSTNGITWLGTIAGVPKTGAWLGFRFRKTNVPAETDETSNNLGVALLVALHGQSNAYLFHVQGSGTPDSLTRKTIDGTTLLTPTGYAATKLGNDLRTIFDCPVLMLTMGHSSAACHEYYEYGTAGYWIPDGSLATPFKTALIAMGGVHAFFWHQGETEAYYIANPGALTPPTAAIYEGYETAMKSTMRTVGGCPISGYTPPYFVAQIGAYALFGCTWDDDDLTINQGKVEGWLSDLNSYISVTRDLALSDQAHLAVTPESSGVLMDRWAQQIAYHYGLATWGEHPYVRDWSIVNSTTTQIRVRMNAGATAITPTTNINTMDVVIDGSRVSTTGALVEYDGQDAVINLTHSAGTVTNIVVYSPWIWDNSTLALPLVPMLDVNSAMAALSQYSWVISSGVIEGLGGSGSYFQPSSGNEPSLTVNKYYRFEYEVVAYTFGNHYLTGFCAQTVLSNVVGSHYIIVQCTNASNPVRVLSDVTNGFVGQLDNIELYEIG